MRREQILLDLHDAILSDNHLNVRNILQTERLNKSSNINLSCLAGLLIIAAESNATKSFHEIMAHNNISIEKIPEKYIEGAMAIMLLAAKLKNSDLVH